MSRKRLGRTLLGLTAGLAIVALAGAEIALHLGARRLAAATERFEAEVGALDPLAHAPVDLPAAGNAADWLRSGAAALELTAEEWQAVDEFLRAETWTPSREIESLVARQARALADLRRAGDLGRSTFGIDYRAGPETLPLDELSEQLRARKVLAADARLALAAGDRRRVLDDLSAIAAQRRALLREPIFVSQLFARAIESGYHDLVQDLLLSAAADAPLLAAAAAELTAGDPQASLASAFAVEAWWMKDAVETAGRGGFRWRPERLVQTFIAADAVDLYRRLRRASELPASEIDAYLFPETPGVPETETRVMGIAARFLVPNLVDGLRKHRASTAARRLAGIAIELRLEALAGGAYPATLEASPAARSSDPYAGGPIRYQRHPDGSAELSFPDAEALWREHNPNAQHLHPPRFVWRLPPGTDAVG